VGARRWSPNEFIPLFRGRKCDGPAENGSERLCEVLYEDHPVQRSNIVLAVSGVNSQVSFG